MGIGEFNKPITAEKIKKQLKVELLNGEDRLDTKIYGFTILDSINTIYLLSGIDFFRDSI